MTARVVCCGCQKEIGVKEGFDEPGLHHFNHLPRLYEGEIWYTGGHGIGRAREACEMRIKKAVMRSFIWTILRLRFLPSLLFGFKPRADMYESKEAGK